ncbi:unnamed protein product [Symbiodinium sp. CCMP2592]|nr:unnamed protein product [Symbiodinium sp. CCMP2592]
MNLEALRIDGESPGAICTIRWPPVADAPDRVLHLAWPLLSRPGAFLLALPVALQEDAVLAAGGATSPFGPSVVVCVPAVEEGDAGEDIPAGYEMSVLLLDLEEAALRFMSLFDPVTESGLVVGFEPSAAHVLPSAEDLMRAALNWVGSDQASALAYVTAQEEEEGVPEVMPKRAAKPKYSSVDQVRVLTERQAALAPSPALPAGSAHQQDFPKVASVAASPPVLASLAAGLPAPTLLAATPKAPVRPAAPPPPALPVSSALPSSSDHLATAIAQQGQALSLLVNHLASQGEALDLTSATAGLGSKGSAKRERLQQELMQRTGTFYLQVCQNAFRKLYPASPVPASLAEFQTDGRLSFVTYLERFGGYAQSRDLALVMHQLAFVADCLVQDDVHGAREHLGLLLASTEQAAQDRNWSLAYLLCLLEEPAPQVYSSRAQGSASRLRAFTPLVSPTWGSTALSYVRELDLLTQRRKDTVSPKAPSGELHDDAAAAPKRRPRFPRKPKASPSGPWLASTAVPSSVASPPLDSIGKCAGQALHSQPFSPSAALSFRRWAFSLASRLIAGKTAFSAFFKRTLHLRWCGQPAPASVFLPLPVPCPGAFRYLGHSGQRRRQRSACQVALHAVVVAVNFIYYDCAFVPLRLLARPPNPAQERCLLYLKGMVQTFGDVKEGIFPSETGRRMNSLIARLTEVSQKLAVLGPLGDPYAYVPAGIEVPMCNTTPDLEPYRSLCAERLRLSGKANWKPEDYLPPELLMAYSLPSSLLCGRTPLPEEYPRADFESVCETRALAVKWASLDLLHLEPAQDLPMHEFTRIFNAYKSADVDRQIGDRRGRNAAEARLPGPSRWLPSADVLCALSADAKKEALCLSMSDRRDFYHQLWAPWSRAVTNRLYPSFSPEEFRGTAEVAKNPDFTGRGPLAAALIGRVAMELQLISVLAPLAATDVSVPYLPRLFATDSSEAKGKALTRGLLLVQGILQRADPLFEDTGEDHGPEEPLPVPGPSRPLAYDFEFLELSLGPPDLSQEIARRGFRVGPHVDLRLGSDWGLQRPIVLDWVMHLIDAGRLLGIYMVPPCASSLPSVRGAGAVPSGSRWGLPGKRYEEAAFVLCAAVFKHANRRGICALLELPASSDFVAGRLWASCRALPYASQIALSACAFGDRRRRDLLGLATGLECSSLCLPCPGDHKHSVPRSGSAATGFKHCAGLVVAYARVLCRALRSLLACTEASDPPVSGLERQCVNDLALGLEWEVSSSWSWPRPIHINILESSVLCRLYKDLAVRYGPCRAVAFCDSFVALSSLGKGRSSSKSLRHSARRASMICLAAGIYPGSMYTPTRLMPADHPTRDNDIPPPVPGLGPAFWTFEAVKQDTVRPRLRRWASSWVRLALLLRPCLGLLAPESVGCADAHLDFRAFVRTRGFDSSIGFPGEGRDKLRELFEKWLALVCYGQYMFKTGKTYSSYSETLNMFSSLCPSLRRLLQPAWDLAFAWQREEPPVHHTAMPWQIVAAALAIALTYGWLDLAGVICLCWGGLARVGEVQEATRADLVLPTDTGTPASRYLLMSIKEPKTRFRAARHQSLRVDQPQLLRIIVMAFGSLQPSEKLWSFSGSTLRNRFKKLMLALRLDRGIVPGVKDFDLGSLRAGGATWLMDMTENPDYVRRRGRWITTKVMEIYVQEVASLTFLPRLPDTVKQHIFAWAGQFAAVVDKVEAWHSFNLPPVSWKFLMAHGLFLFFPGCALGLRHCPVCHQWFTRTQDIFRLTVSFKTQHALGSGLSLQETQQREAQAELLLLQCWGEDGMILDAANKHQEMEDADDQGKERDAKWARPESKGGFGRGGRGKGNQSGQPPQNNGPRRQPFRRPTESDSKAPDGMMWLLGKLLLRHEDQMGIDRTQNGFVMFFKRESALSLVPLFVQKSQHWNALKEQKQEKMDEIALPLRTFLFHTMMETLVKRIKDTVKNDEQLKTAITLQVFLPKEGDSELRIPFLSYNPETKSLAPRQDQPPILVSAMLEKLQILQKQCLCPLAIMRFHSTQRLNGPLQGPTVPFLLQVGHRSPEAAELYLSLRSLANSAVWQLVGGSLRPEKMGRSALAAELARRLQGSFTQTGCSLNHLSDLVRGYAFSRAANDYAGACPRPLVGSPMVRDCGDAWPMLLATPPSQCDAGTSGRITIQRLIHAWKDQAAAGLTAMDSEPGLLVLQVNRFSPSAAGAKDVTSVLPDPRILIPCFQHHPIPQDAALCVRHCEYQLIAIILHEGPDAASGHYRALLCTYPPDSEPVHWQCDDAKEPTVHSELSLQALTTGYLYFYCRTVQPEHV